MQQLHGALYPPTLSPSKPAWWAGYAGKRGGEKFVKLYPAKIFDHFRSAFLANTRYKRVIKDDYYDSRPISTYLHTVAYSDRSYQDMFKWWLVEGDIYFSLHGTIFNSQKFVRQLLPPKPVKTIEKECDECTLLTKYGDQVNPATATKILAAIGISKDAAAEKAFRREA